MIQGPLDYCIQRAQETSHEQHIAHYSYPQWVECFGIYKSNESGLRRVQEGDKQVIKQVCAPYVQHILLKKYTQERVQKLFDKDISVPPGDITLHDEKYGYLGDYVFIGEQGWATSATEQYIEDAIGAESPRSFHIGLDGKPLYAARFKQTWDFEGVGERKVTPYRSIHGENHAHFEGVFPIGITGSGSPLSTHPLVYATITHTSYRARALTFDDVRVWIDGNGNII